ncbi:MAG: Hsp70 family protein [Chloroflexaceae bacterium]|jgi:molecular chaperone DnaK|nr:Hsp70 family protein [Chloroflexaceae bacterium]
MNTIIGIDLGTTFSAVGLVRNGVPQLLTHHDERIMPSVVGFTPQGMLLVGTPARNQYALNPDRTIRSIKRNMGQHAPTTIGNRTYSPQQISALILRELKRRAEAQLGEPVTRAVITVPAYFSDAARQATREAGEIAGFTVERIINEPTAAALAYGLDRGNERQLVAVYDLGGGTFDVSIIELDSGVVEVRASHGNTQLGGDDFDQRLVNILAQHMVREHSVDPRSDRRANARLTRAAEAAKISLSSQPVVRVREEYLLTVDGKPLHLDIEITREQFESLIRDLLEGTMHAFDAAMRDAGLETRQLDRIVLVGGSTRMPCVRQMLQQHTGLEPETVINPDEAVALGAAVQAAIIAGQPLDAILVDVAPHALGIEIATWEMGDLVADRYNVIIPRNTTIPTSRSEMYHALHPEQDAIEIKIYQGERPIASENTLLGEFVIDDISAETPGQPAKVLVQFDFDINGMLHVSAVDRGSGKQARISVKAAHAQMSLTEIATTPGELAAVGGHKAVEKQVEAVAVHTHQQITLDAHGQGLLLRARQVLAKSPNQAIQTAIAALEGAARSGDQGVIEARTEELLDLLYDAEE